MIHYKDFLCKDSNRFSSQKIRHIREEVKNEIINITSFFPDQTSILIRLVSIRQGFTHDNPPSCLYCGKLITSMNQGQMNKYCNSKCYSKTEQFKNKLKTVDHEKANQKRQKTMLDKYRSFV
jgi:hypothetical protein